MGCQIAEGLRVIASPKMLIRIVSWMRPPPRVVKLTMDGCSKDNPRVAASGGIFCDHRGTVLVAFRSFLGCQLIFMLSVWQSVRG